MVGQAKRQWPSEHNLCESNWKEEKWGVNIGLHTIWLQSTTSGEKQQQ